MKATLINGPYNGKVLEIPYKLLEITLVDPNVYRRIAVVSENAFSSASHRIPVATYRLSHPGDELFYYHNYVK
jgi:hypothetical protein